MSDRRGAKQASEEARRSPLAYGAKDAAQAIGISERTLWALAIPRCRVGRRVVWLASDLTHYLEQRRDMDAA